MIGKLKEATSTLSNPYLKKWKNAGKAIIGYPCTFVPEEIIHAVFYPARR